MFKKTIVLFFALPLLAGCEGTVDDLNTAASSGIEQSNKGTAVLEKSVSYGPVQDICMIIEGDLKQLEELFNNPPENVRIVKEMTFAQALEYCQRLVYRDVIVSEPPKILCNPGDPTLSCHISDPGSLSEAEEQALEDALANPDVDEIMDYLAAQGINWQRVGLP